MGLELSDLLQLVFISDKGPYLDKESLSSLFPRKKKIFFNSLEKTLLEAFSV